MATTPVIDERLSTYLTRLRLPVDFTGRRAKNSVAVDRIMATHQTAIEEGRNFAIGLFFAFVSVAEQVLAIQHKSLLKNALKVVPYSKTGATLTFTAAPGSGGRVSLRATYVDFEHVVKSSLGLRRFGYPSMAPTASWRWIDYRDEINRIFAMSPEERLALAERLWARVLELPASKPRIVGNTVRPFERILEKLSMAAADKEPPGALLQALAFAYYRADAPNVTLETGKAQSGSRRTGNIGDIDGWSGKDLVLSVEVKDYVLVGANVQNEMTAFEANLAWHPDATAIVVARGFDADARKWLEQHNILRLDRDAMARNVALWDMRKQQMATRECLYYLERVQGHPGLTNRFEKFLEDEKLDW